MFTADYTRDVDTGVFERPASYCYDSHRWVQSRQCKTTTHTRSGPRTIDGCATQGNIFTGCCAASFGPRRSATNRDELFERRMGPGPPLSDNCSSVVWGQAHP